MIKLIMSDMDGTLLDENGQLPAGFADVAAQLKARGVIFAPCSGRQYYSLLRTFAGYEDEFLFLAENGTIVKYHDEEIFSCPMRREDAMKVLEAAKENPGTYRVFCGKKDAYILKDQDTEEFRELFPETADCVIVGLFPLGKPEMGPGPRHAERRPLSEMVRKL